MKMSLAQRVLLSWIFSLTFLIMLVLKLDSTISWNWFLVFLPVWAFDLVLVLMLLVRVGGGRCRSETEGRRGEWSAPRRLWYLTALLLQLCFCLVLCSRLQGLTDTWLCVVCAPLWVLLGGALVELGHSVFTFNRD